jgi:hypothetical protein
VVGGASSADASWAVVVALLNGKAIALGGTEVLFGRQTLDHHLPLCRCHRREGSSIIETLRKAAASFGAAKAGRGQ